MSAHAEIRWVEASYHAIHQVLTNPVYAGAYVYGKTRTPAPTVQPQLLLDEPLTDAPSLVGNDRSQTPPALP